MAGAEYSSFRPGLHELIGIPGLNEATEDFRYQRHRANEGASREAPGEIPEQRAGPF